MAISKTAYLLITCSTLDFSHEPFIRLLSLPTETQSLLHLKLSITNGNFEIEDTIVFSTVAHLTSLGGFVS